MNFSTKLKDLLTFGTSNLISSIVLGIFWLYLASILAKAEYGELGYLLSIVNVAAAVSLMGLHATVVVYEPKKENIFPVSLVLILISSGISAAIVYVLTQNVIVSLLIIGMSFFILLTAGLNSKQRYKDYSKHILIRTGIIVVLAIILNHFLGINGIIMGYLVASLIVLLEISSLKMGRKIEFKNLRGKFGFTINMWVTRISDILFWWGDKVLIGSLFGFSILGNYHLAAQFLLLLDAIPRSLYQYLIPEESKGSKNKKIKIVSLAIACVIAVISIIFIPYVIEFLLPEYKESIVPIQIMSISIIPLTISAIKQSEFLGKENSRVILIANFLQAGVYFLLIILLGQEMGLAGIAIGFLIGSISRAIFNLTYSKYNHV